MMSKLFTIAALCGLVACTEMEQPTSGQQSQEPIDDGSNPSLVPPPTKGAGTSNLVGNGPIAYGVILADGSKAGGTSNWSSTYNATYQRYEISITGESYHYLSYATVVTPTVDLRICRTNSVGGDLLVYCNDLAGNPATSRFHFVTSKP